MEIRIFEKYEPNSQRGNNKNCDICFKEFGVFNREHQCKRCFRAICAECGTTKRDVYKLKFTKRPHRLCLHCTQQSNFIIDFISVNKLEFGKDSQMALKWHKRLSQDEKTGSIGISKSRNVKKFTQQIFKQLWDSYNFSLREIIGLLTFAKNQNDVYLEVSKVYEDIQLRGVDQKLQNIIYIVVFLLCFSSTEICADLIVGLYEFRRPLTDGKQLLNLYLKSLGMNEADIKKLSDYSNFKMKSFIGAISINTVTTECSIHLVTRIFQKKKIEEVFMLYALVLESNKDFIISKRSNKSECDFEILRKCKLSKYLDKYRMLVSVKTAPFMNMRKQSAEEKKVEKISENSQYKSSRGSSNEQVNFVANFRKKKVNDDNSQDSLSSKTKSIRDSEIPSQDVDYSPRKTQKLTVNSNLTDKQPISNIKRQKHSMSQLKPVSNNLQKFSNSKNSSFCSSCQERVRIIEQLENKLEMKDRQISKIHTELTLKSRQVENFYHQSRPQDESQSILLKNQEIAKLEQQLLEKCQQNDKNFKVLTNYQKQLMNMKSQVQELNTNNRLLKNRIESANYSSLNTMTRNSDKEEQIARQNQVLKKTLLDKNKELEELMKKNRLLSFQIDENEKAASINNSLGNNIEQEDVFDKTRRLQSENEALWKKIKEISDKVNDEEGEKMRLSQQLFELKELMKDERQRNSIMSLPEKSPEKKTTTKENDNCRIF